MARRATPVTKGRTAPKKMAASGTPAREAASPTRRGAKAKPQDESPIEMPITDTAVAGADASAHEAEMTTPKARRGRKPKPDMMADDHESADEAVDPEIVPSVEPELPEMEVATPKPPSSPRKTRRNREPEASAPPPLEVTEEPSPEPQAAAAAEWHAETGVVTFDWPAIEQVAAAEGPNQPIAKLLLAARAEGARSRWPF